ncbi:hypothetical protein C450_04953 [Halococcus salifodinae DSM 8989]|uniref:Uncharacterized protein n=1 Tax=Halococcus salifodinae DSM 8989 TaxID=1227456 RepID=M0NDL8_9EURY|nr:hypothetical protein C450_04953 [Halococcus salifodinae DSM 8989]
MHVSPFSTDQDGRFGRTVTIALVAALFVSTIAGAIAAPPVAAQQNGSEQDGGGDSITKQEFRNWISKVMGMESKGAAQEAARKNPDKVDILARAFKQNVDTSLSGTRLTDTIKQRPQYVINTIKQASGGGPFPAPVAAANNGGGGGGGGGNSTNESANGTAENGTAGNGSEGGPTSNESVNRIISEFTSKNLGYNQLSQENKSRANDILLSVTQGNLSQQQINSKFTNLEQLFANASGAGNLGSTGLKEQRRQIVMEYVGEREKHNPIPKIDIDIPGLLDQKLESFADSMREGAAGILKKVYGLAFSTPVPQNDGWQGVLGTPTNEPFQSLYEQLLKGKLYPVLNYLLGTAVIVMGISLVVNPLMSRFRALDLAIKFVSFLLLYVSAWAAVTLMHGAVDGITVWLRPSEQAMEALATNVTKLSAGAIGAYFIGAGGILASVFSLGVELGLRKVALQYFFPYVFPALLLLLYVSPWRRLKSFASVVIWQYVNVLTMVIPMAILLKAAAIVSFTTSDGVVAMLVLVALFLFAVSIPTITTYTFLQVPGKAASVGKSAAAGAADRASTAKDKLGWDGDDSASTGTATADTSPGSRTEQAVEVSTDGGTTGIPSSGELAPEQVENIDPTGGSATTAGQVRDLEQAEHQDPMNPSAMKESYFEDHPQRMTMDEKLASQS